MSKKDEAMKLALEALEEYVNVVVSANDQNEWTPKVVDAGGPARKAITALREALAEQPAQQEPVNKYCCHLCFNKSGQVFLDRMILCPECGNKRCPKATHHDLPCTKSNDLGQKGSIYDQPAQRTWVGLTDEEWQSIADTLGCFITRGQKDAIEAALGIKEKNT